MNRKEFDTLKEQLARSRQETAVVKREVDSWQNSTILILKQNPIENLSEPIWMTWASILVPYKIIVLNQIFECQQIYLYRLSCFSFPFFNLVIILR